MTAHGLAVAATSLLGGVFVVAGVSKLAGVDRWRRHAAGLGVPRVLAQAMPFVEVVLGACLVAQVQRRWSAAVAALLVASFTVLLATHLNDDDPPPCACFGGLSDAPISWRHVARNVGLIVLAAAGVVG